MIDSKHINKMVAGFVIFAILACAWIVYAANAYELSYVLEYQKRLFNGEIAAIDINVDEDEWQNLLDNAGAKPWVSADIAINGEKFESVGIRTKGNSSLSSAVRSEGDRYSLQFSMNKNIKGQTYYGLDTFCVNNLINDATYMKDYISYDIMKFIGVDSPLANHAKITVNGEDYGFCLLLERYDKGFLDRVYDTSAGNLYNVKIQMGQRDNFMNFGQAVESEQDNQPRERPDRNADRANNRNDRDNWGDRGNMPGGRGGGFGGSNGGSLVYADDELASYSSIFDNAVFGRTNEDDMQRVVTAIKNLNDGTELERYWDVDGALRYFAAHTFVVNLDSYVSNMQQNYALYEKDGKVTIFPWDYDLAFGGFQSGSASSVINFPIDTPVSGVNMGDRPLLNVLLEIPEYKEKYHDYLRRIVDGYVNSGLLEQTIRELDAKINEYVKNDATSYYTYEKYESAIETLIELCLLRAKSVAGQLDGTIPSTTDGQREDSSALVDATGINLSDLGGAMMGGGMGNFGGNREMPNMPDGFEWDPDNMPENFQDRFSGQFPDGIPDNNRDRGRPPDMPNTNNPNNFGEPPVEKTPPI